MSTIKGLGILILFAIIIGGFFVFYEKNNLNDGIVVEADNVPYQEYNNKSQIADINKSNTNILTINESEEIIKSFFLFLEEQNGLHGDPEYYKNLDLYIDVDKKTDDNLKGMIKISNVERHSTPYFLATKIDDEWKFIFQGQDMPSCDLVDKYNIPTKLFWPNTDNACFITKTEVRRH